jgi:hypothetical protein
MRAQQQTLGYIIAHAVHAASASYQPGDTVPMMRRTQHSGRRTAWHEVPHRATPRFLTDTRSTMDGAPADVPATEPFKMCARRLLKASSPACDQLSRRCTFAAPSLMRFVVVGSSLALHGLQFVTPWIVVADGNGRFLSHLDLLLTASGDALTAVRWETQYVDETPPTHISVHTTWQHSLEHDLSSALSVLFVVAAVLVAALAYATCRQHGASTLAKLLQDEPDEEPPQRSTGYDVAPRGYYHESSAYNVNPRGRAGRSAVSSHRSHDRYHRPLGSRKYD